MQLYGEITGLNGDFFVKETKLYKPKSVLLIQKTENRIFLLNQILNMRLKLLGQQCAIPGICITSSAIPLEGIRGFESCAKPSDKCRARMKIHN